jgi:AraC-like DNA-binding protein
VPKVPAASFTTDAIEPEHRFEAWRDMLAVSHEIGAEPDGFSGTVHSTRLGGMVVHVMDASPQSTTRDVRRIRLDGLEHFVLHVASTSSRAEAGDTELAIPAYGISVSDLSRPSRRSVIPERGSIIVSLARGLITEAHGTTDALHGHILEQGAGALLGAHLRSLAEHAATVDEAAALAVARGTAQLLAACIDPSRDRLERARAQVETATLSRARRYIGAHLHRADLSPEAIMRAVAVSRSTLFRLFEPFGGVARYVTAERLKAARRALASPGGHHRISDIARRHGFSTDAQFSREFKRSFGMSPSDYRHLAPGAERAAGTPQTDSFHDWVRDLG